MNYFEDKDFMQYFLDSKSNGVTHGMSNCFFKVLTNLCLDENIANLDETVKELFNNTGYHSSNDIKRIKNALVGACYLLTHYTNLNNVDTELVYSMSDYYILKIDQSLNYEKLIGLASKIIISFRNLINMSSSGSQNYQISRCLKYISSNLYSPIKVKNISEFLNLTPEYLSTLFKKEMEIGLYRYIEIRKIEESKLLLHYTTLSIGEISDTLGYSSISHFSKSFKNITGKAPRTYPRY